MHLHCWTGWRMLEQARTYTKHTRAEITLKANTHAYSKIQDAELKASKISDSKSYIYFSPKGSNNDL